MTNNYNLKIPLEVATKYKLPSLAILVYGEIYGICIKKQPCYLTDQTLAERLNSNTRSIQRAISKLKLAGLIQRLKTENMKKRKLAIVQIKSDNFILIPSFILTSLSINMREKVIYGYLTSERKKIEKSNRDKYQNFIKPSITLTKKQLADTLNVSPNTIRLAIKHLSEIGYLKYTSVKGKSLNIEVLNFEEIFANLPQKWRTTLHPLLNNLYRVQKEPTSKVANNLPQKWRQPTSKVANNLPQNRRTNRVFNRVINRYINKGQFHSKKQLDYSKKQNESKSSTNSEKLTKYIPFNGFNLEYQCLELQKMLRNITGKKYALTANHKPLIENALKNGYTLNDFENVITSLSKANKSISVKDITKNISKYISKTN